MYAGLGRKENDICLSLCGTRKQKLSLCHTSSHGNSYANFIQHFFIYGEPFLLNLNLSWKENDIRQTESLQTSTSVQGFPSCAAVKVQVLRCSRKALRGTAI